MLELVDIPDLESGASSVRVRVSLRVPKTYYKFGHSYNKLNKFVFIPNNYPRKNDQLKKKEYENENRTRHCV